jgi:hypothetical protein
MLLCDPLRLFKARSSKLFFIISQCPLITPLLLHTTTLAYHATLRKYTNISEIALLFNISVRCSPSSLALFTELLFLECACPRNHSGPCRLILCLSIYPCSDKLLATARTRCAECLDLRERVIRPYSPMFDLLSDRAQPRMFLFTILLVFFSLLSSSRFRLSATPYACIPYSRQFCRHAV